MKSITKITLLVIVCLVTTFCTSGKKLAEIEAGHTEALNKCIVQLDDHKRKLDASEKAKARLELEAAKLPFKDEQIADLKAQLADCKDQRDKQLTQVGDLTVLSQSASDNIKETLVQLEQKDKYIHLLQAARSKADSLNLALAVNLKGVLKDGIADNDVEIKVDKTVVFINLSDGMLYQSGSAMITPRAGEILGKIATIVQSRPNMEIMVEGYTDNVPINSTCMQDNWDLSVKRATAVVRALQTSYGVDPNRLIAAGRGEFNTLASNETAEGRIANRRTRIIILPKIDEFYDLLDPDKAAAKID